MSNNTFHVHFLNFVNVPWWFWAYTAASVNSWVSPSSQCLACGLPGKPEKHLIFWASWSDYDSALVLLGTSLISWVIRGLLKRTIEFLSNHVFTVITPGNLHSVLVALSDQFVFPKCPLVFWDHSVFHDSTLAVLSVLCLSTVACGKPKQFIIIMGGLWCLWMHPSFLNTSFVFHIGLHCR